MDKDERKDMPQNDTPQEECSPAQEKTPDQEPKPLVEEPRPSIFDGKPEEFTDDMKVESEWADKLGMEYKPEQIMSQSQSREQPQPLYVMPISEPVGLDAPNRVPQPMPPTCMVWAILSMICCCLPAGIVAIIFSAQVSSRYFAKDYEGARKASERAQIWIIVAIVAGIVINALYLPLSLLMSEAMTFGG